MPTSLKSDNALWREMYVLANSGNYSGWLTIELELRALGYGQAQQILDDESLRTELDRCCRQAWQRRGNAIAIGWATRIRT